jgi:hypothetical protein
MGEPKIYMPESGIHNSNLEASVKRLEDAKTYSDLSTVIVCPTRGVIPCRVVGSWFNLIRPMNQKIVGPIFMSGMEVGYAYEKIIEEVLASPVLSKFKYLLTIEEDNMPLPDGLMKLYESIEGGVDGVKYDVVGGLYWTKGEMGQPMIYGDPKVMPLNFIPQVPKPETVQRANGLGMGFNLFRMSMFSKIDRPWFKTEQSYSPDAGVRMYTQDLFFYEKAAKKGFLFACDNRVRVGHLDWENDIVW